MNCHIDINKCDFKERTRFIKAIYASVNGSASIEAIIMVSIITGIIMFFVSIMQIAAAQNILEVSVIRTGEKMCKWAPIYKYLVADNLECVIEEGIVTKLDGKISSEAEEMITHIVNLSNISNTTSDYAYGYIAQWLCQKHIDESAFVNKNVVKMMNLNLYKSRFFINQSNLINLKAVCEVETFLPFAVDICHEVNCSAWGKGVFPHSSLENNDEKEDGNKAQSIWSRDNLSRGSILRSIYGGNLPDNYPVISIYENGIATMIKSMDHTARSYSDTSLFTRNIKEMINTLSDFNGASWGGIEISDGDIKIKRLLLVMPENEFLYGQDLAMAEVRRYATTKGVLFDLQRYQRV